MDTEEVPREQAQSPKPSPCNLGKHFDCETCGSTVSRLPCSLFPSHKHGASETGGCSASERLPHSSPSHHKQGASETGGWMPSQVSPSPICSSCKGCGVDSSAQGKPQLHGRQGKLGQHLGKHDRGGGKLAHPTSHQDSSAAKTSNTWCGVSLGPLRGSMADGTLSVASLWRREDNFGRTAEDRWSENGQR